MRAAARPRARRRERAGWRRYVSRVSSRLSRSHSCSRRTSSRSRIMARTRRGRRARSLSAASRCTTPPCPAIGERAQEGHRGSAARAEEAPASKPRRPPTLPPHLEAGPLAQGWHPSGSRPREEERALATWTARRAAAALRCLPTVADFPLRLDYPGIGAPAPSRSPPLRSPPSARSPTPLRRCLARSATRRWRPTCQQPTAPARDRSQTGSRCCRCRRRRCRSRPPRTLPPPERGRAAVLSWWATLPCSQGGSRVAAV